jgi:integral membrane protein
MKNPVSLLRSIALMEGASFVLLMSVAMPLKYLANIPWPVTVVGWAHGVLFVALGLALLHVMVVARWPIGRGLMVCAAALLPFGPFVIDGRMKRYADEFAAARYGPSPACAGRG